jgi:hypothetical protein
MGVTSGAGTAYLSSPSVFSGVRVTWSLVLCVCFVDRFFVLSFFFAIVLSVLPFMDSDYLFGIFKLFLDNKQSITNRI